MRLRNRHGLRRGFTLVEMVVVVIIMAVLFAVTLPSLRSTAKNNRLRSSVRELMSLMKYARTEAVFNGRTTEVFLSLEENQFWLDLRTPDPKTGRYNPKDKKSTMERKRDLEKQVSFKGIDALPGNILQNEKVIACDFYPDGTASPTLITLENDRDAVYTIEILKSTGMVELTQGTLETVQATSGARSYPLPENYNEGYGTEEMAE